MNLSTKGSISEACAAADAGKLAEILRTRLQEKQDELLAWVNEWHLVDMHALVFVMETTLTLLRSQMSPQDEKMLKRLHAVFCSVASSMMVPKRRNGNDT